MIQDGTAHLGVGLPLSSNGDACGDFAFDGKIDDIKLFNKTLSLIEILELYNEADPLLPVIGLINPESQKLNLYPNPVNNYISFNNINMLKVDVYNILGSVVLKDIYVYNQPV